jgi:hypothetical protein
MATIPCNMQHKTCQRKVVKEFSTDVKILTMVGGHYNHTTLMLSILQRIFLKGGGGVKLKPHKLQYDSDPLQTMHVMWIFP